MGGDLHIILLIALVVAAVQVIQGPKRVQVFGPLGDMNDMAKHGENMNEERESQVHPRPILFDWPVSGRSLPNS
jgi:hypothetical protein